MKWHSVRKYHIPCGLGELFVAIPVDEMVVYKMAEYDYDRKNDDYGWFCIDKNRLIGITHFCIPDPVEIED